MDGIYGRYYAVGAAQGKEEGNFRFPRNTVRYVHKIIERLYDHLFICHTTHFRFQTEFINFQILILV